MKLLVSITLLFSCSVYAQFDISYEVLNCDLSINLCEIRVEYTDPETTFHYENSCYDIDPSSESLQYCIEDLEVRAYRIFNNSN